MGKQHRLTLKRKVAQARNDLDRALVKIAYLHSEFVSVHPEHAELLEGIGKGVIFSKSLLEDFWRIAWGSSPENWDTYVGDGRKRG